MCAGVCIVIQDESVNKAVCTRALWTLSNQRLTINDHVTTIVSVVTELVMSSHLTTPTVDSEALNVIIRYPHSPQIPHPHTSHTITG